MANEQNLIPFTSEQSREEAKKNGQKGGIASGEARRNRKKIRDELEAMLDMHPVGKDGKEIDMSYQSVMIAALLKKALKGDTKAFEIIRDTIGEKPAEKVMLAQVDQATIDEVEQMVKAHDKTAGS